MREKRYEVVERERGWLLRPVPGYTSHLFLLISKEGAGVALLQIPEEVFSEGVRKSARITRRSLLKHPLSAYLVWKREGIFLLSPSGKPTKIRGGKAAPPRKTHSSSHIEEGSELIEALERLKERSVPMLRRQAI